MYTACKPYVLYIKTHSHTQHFNQNNFQPSNPCISCSAEPTRLAKNNKSTCKECRCGQKLDADVRRNCSAALVCVSHGATVRRLISI